MGQPINDDVHELLTAAEDHKKLKQASKAKYDNNICRPMQPFGKGGEVYVYQLASEKDIDWKADGCN